MAAQTPDLDSGGADGWTMAAAQDVERWLREHDAGTLLKTFAGFSCSEEQAYAVQSQVCRLRERRGETIIGYKVGCTSSTTQRRLGIDHPVFGRLFDSECWPSGATLPPSRFNGLAVEGELAVRLAADLPTGDLPDAAILDAVECAFAVIEMHHFAFPGAPRAPALIAANAMHAGFVHANAPASRLDMRPATLRIVVDDVEVATVSGLELTRNVVRSLRWLGRELSLCGLGLQAGQTVLCGSVADLIPVARPCRIAVATDRFGFVECDIEEIELRGRAPRGGGR